MMEKDCTEELMECTTECPPNDKECHDDCIEEYHACDISKEFTPEDVEQCIIDGNDYKDCVDHMVATNELHDDTHVDEGELISEILTITALLNGKCTRSHTLTSTGRSSKVITIEYDIQFRDKGSSEET
tara:strand:+ start:122 stop:508 length:387 start_codon:yes stop_codon:yes gene_type:complete